MKRAEVLKTYKLFIGGKFPRSESGYYYQVKNPKTKAVIANVAQGSRKDLREAVKAARAAFGGWSKKTAYNRSQILYRIAEMIESRKAEFIDHIQSMGGSTAAKAEKEVLASIDRLIWYAGWADKYQQIFGSSNPVAAPYFNFSMPEPTGVVGVIAADEMALLPLISQLAPAIVSGNTVVILASETLPLTAITLAEVIETSDVPAGVINILTGVKKDLIPHLAKHMDVNAIQYVGSDQDTIKLLQLEGTENLKRICVSNKVSGQEWFNEKSQSPYWISDLTETKTTWHPVGV